MVIAGIVILVVALLMELYPVVFLKLKTPNKDVKPYMVKLVRIWGAVCIVIAVIMIIKELI